jgi:hypothetical protein
MMEIKYTPEEKVDLLNALSLANEIDKALMDMPNKKIGELLFFHIWANMDILTPQSSIVEQAILRLGFEPEEENDS